MIDVTMFLATDHLFGYYRHVLINFTYVFLYIHIVDDLSVSRYGRKRSVGEKHSIPPAIVHGLHRIS